MRRKTIIFFIIIFALSLPKCAPQVSFATKNTKTNSELENEQSKTNLIDEIKKHGLLFKWKIKF